MSGVAIIRTLLAGNAAVKAVVPPERIMAGDLPLHTPLPAISVTQISSVPFNLLRVNETPRLHTDRVQVTWMLNGTDMTPVGAGYPGVKALGRLVLTACPSQRGTIGGVFCESITPDVEGPDFADDSPSMHSSSRDFIVKWVDS